MAELCRELDSVPEGLVLACDRWLRLGRALKTEFVLQYMSEPQLRAKVRRGLLKVEQLHALARAVYYGQRGRSAPEWCSVP
ncbi:MAG: Tn3 family transposase [Chromatiales bacterium]|nr:Tn3 family transposase [Chromatiales bacterium]